MTKNQPKSIGMELLTARETARLHGGKETYVISISNPVPGDPTDLGGGFRASEGDPLDANDGDPDSAGGGLG